MFNFLKGKSKGVIADLPATFIAVLVAIIILFSVLMPITNTSLYANGSGTNGTGLNSVVNVWNNTGYPTALTTAQTLPILFVLVFFISIALVVIRTVGMA